MTRGAPADELAQVPDLTTPATTCRSISTLSTTGRSSRGTRPGSAATTSTPLDVATVLQSRPATREFTADNWLLATTRGDLLLGLDAPRWRVSANGGPRCATCWGAQPWPLAPPEARPTRHGQCPGERPRARGLLISPPGGGFMASTPLAEGLCWRLRSTWPLATHSDRVANARRAPRGCAACRRRPRPYRAGRPSATRGRLRVGLEVGVDTLRG